MIGHLAAVLTSVGLVLGFRRHAWWRVEAAGAEQVRKRKEPEAAEGQDRAKPGEALAKRGEELKKSIDDVIGTIDDILEENAEEFLKAYVQRGGE